MRQLDLVFAITIKREWLTLDHIAEFMLRDYGTRASTPSISARLRQLRAAGFIVERQLLAPGLWAYRVRRNEPRQTDLREIV